MSDLSGESRSIHRSSVRRILGLLIMVISLGAVIWTITADEEGWEVLTSVGIPAVAALVLLQSAGLVTQAYRYRLTVDEAAGSNLPFLSWLRLFVVGRFLNAIAPQAGNAYRAVRLREDYAIPITRYLSGFLAFIWLSTLLNLVLALAVILVVEPELRFGEVPAVTVIAGLLTVTAASPPLALWLFQRRRVESATRWGWLYRRTEDMLSGAVRVARSGRTLGRFFGAALAGLAIWVAAFAVSFEALGLEVSFASVVVFYVLQQLGTYLNITPGNLGLQELYSGALAAQLGIGLTGGLLVATLIRLTALITLLAVGTVLGGFRSFRRIRRSPPGP